MKPAPPSAPPAPTPSPRVKAAISVLVTLHVAAVFAAPWAMIPSSELSRRMYMVFRPYLEAAFLDHGYAFFAPNPGPSHLVKYELEFADGRKSERIFPNLAEQQPRLIYHRHFMLSEFLNSQPPDSPLIQSFVRSYAAHLLTANDAQRVTLVLRRHLIPDPQQVLDGMKLDDARLYEDRLLGTFDLAAATAPVEFPADEDIPVGRPVREPLGPAMEPGL